MPTIIDTTASTHLNIAYIQVHSPAIMYLYQKHLQVTLRSSLAGTVWRRVFECSLERHRHRQALVTSDPNCFLHHKIQLQDYGLTRANNTANLDLVSNHPIINVWAHNRTIHGLYCNVPTCTVHIGTCNCMTCIITPSISKDCDTL